MLYSFSAETWDFEQRAFNQLFITKLQILQAVHLWKDKQNNNKKPSIDDGL